MADINHGWAYLNGIPITGAKVTLDSEGAAIGTGCRIVGPVSYKPGHNKTNIDENESGVVVGKRRFDSTEACELGIKLASNFTDFARLTPGAIVTLASVTPSIMNGVWEIDDSPYTFAADDATVVSLSLIRSSGFTPTAQNPS